MSNEENKFYVYMYLDPRKPGAFKYGDFEFKYEPFYVGKGSGDRMYAHLHESKLKEKFFKSRKMNKIIRLGYNLRDGFILKIKDFLTEKESIDLEILAIKTIGRRDLNLGPLTNQTNGGDGLVGAVRTNSWKRKISKSHLGKNLSEEHKRKISITQTGRRLSEEHKKSISLAGMGRLAWNRGMEMGPQTEERRRKCGIAIRKLSYGQMAEAMNLYDKMKSARNVAKIFGVDKSTILNIKNNRQKYFNEEEKRRI